VKPSAGLADFFGTDSDMYQVAIVEIDQGERQLCYSPGSLAIHVGDHCVFQSERMLEYGSVAKLDKFDGEPDEPLTSKVLRCATLRTRPR
jgi:hypothetical protein